MPHRSSHIFTREEARILLPFLQRLTGQCREELEHLWAHIDGDTPEPELQAAFARMNVIREKWYREIRATGAWPRRLWEVSFDSGDGYYYSWRVGESDILFIHRQDLGHITLRRYIGSSAVR